MHPQPTISISGQNVTTNIKLLSRVILSKYFKYLMLVIGGFLLYQLLIKRKRWIFSMTENLHYLDPNEIIPKVNYYLYPKNTINYMFWNGDFNSTALLYDLLINKGLPVQTIYIKNETMDTNLTQFGDSNNSLDRNINYEKQQNIELQRMKHIRQIIFEDYPFCKSSFLPTFYVYNIKKDLALTAQFIKHVKKGKVIRPDLNKVERYIRYSYFSELDKPILYSLDVGDLELYNVLHTTLDSDSKYYLKSKLEFPMIRMSRDDIKINMLEQTNHKKIKLILYLRAKKEY
mgnify:CR=1 FL=1